jgi:hypothetical protein
MRAPSSFLAALQGRPLSDDRTVHNTSNNGYYGGGKAGEYAQLQNPGERPCRCCTFSVAWDGEEGQISILFLGTYKMSADQIHFFLHLRDQIKLYHWQTRVYSRHIATDKILEKLDKSIDAYVEIYIGKYGRPRLSGKNATISLQNLSEAGAVRLVSAAIKYLQGPLTKSLKPIADSDLVNIRDEMIGDLNQLLYLFTLK